jgi:hypothetical protein
MKIVKLVLLGLAISCLSSAAFADSTWNDMDGTLTSFSGVTGYYLSNAGSASSLVSVTGAGSLYDCGGGTPCNGKVSYTTGMTAGFNTSLINNIGGPATSLGNGTLKITLPGIGTGPGGLVFLGTFSDITWTYIGTCTATGCTKGEYYQWEVMGNISGTYYLPGGGTSTAKGFNVQLTTQKFTGSDPFANGTGHITGGGGAVSMGVVPESGTLILFGTGLVGIALLVRRKHFSGFAT